MIDANGCDIVVERDTDFLARFNDEELADVTVTKLRLKRFLDGSDWKLSAYYHDGEDWVTDEAWVGIVDDQELYAYLSLSGKVGYLRWSDFLDTVGDPYPTAGEYESRVYDAGRSVDFTRISWNEVCPTGTDVSFQVAVSEDPEGPWSYGSALTTAAGTTITSTTGRYARFKVSMTSDGSDTPVINDVQITHDGTSGSRVTRWTYDEAGNITKQARVTDAGTETDTRSYNNLNQLDTSSGGWSYQFDASGNMIGKNNGTTEGCEKWELAWSEQSRLVQVKKGVYDATPVLVTEFQVDYQNDEAGRMLRRDDGTDVTNYFYDGWDIWKEVTGESMTEYLVPGLGILSILRDGELYTLHLDGLNSVRRVTDSGGAVVARMEFDAWGETLAGSVDLIPAGPTLGFVGGLGVRRDPLTGLLWMRYRWYDPQQGRFISRDPIGLDGGSNLYGYAGSSPVDTFDPTGLQPPGYRRPEDRGPQLRNCPRDYSNIPSMSNYNRYGYGVDRFGKEYPRSAQEYAQLQQIQIVFSGLAAQQLILNAGGAVISPGQASADAYASIPIARPSVYPSATTGGVLRGLPTANGIGGNSARDRRNIAGAPEFVNGRYLYFAHSWKGQPYSGFNSGHPDRYGELQVLYPWEIAENIAGAQNYAGQDVFLGSCFGLTNGLVDAVAEYLSMLVGRKVDVTGFVGRGGWDPVKGRLFDMGKR